MGDGENKERDVDRIFLILYAVLLVCQASRAHIILSDKVARFDGLVALFGVLCHLQFAKKKRRSCYENSTNAENVADNCVT